MTQPTTRTHTDNTSIAGKVKLRKIATENLEEIKVLDCFGGNNNMWKTFDCAKYYGIEQEKGKGKKNIWADNKKIIPSLDLSQFNVIDLDSYGIPAVQIDLCFKNPTLKDGTVIVYTAIGNSMSVLDRTLIKENNLTRLYKECKCLFNGIGRDLFHSFLYKKGVRKITFFRIDNDTSFQKEYGFFVVKKS